MQTQMRASSAAPVVLRVRTPASAPLTTSFVGAKLPVRGEATVELRGVQRRSAAPAALEVRTKSRCDGSRLRLKRPRRAPACTPPRPPLRCPAARLHGAVCAPCSALWPLRRRLWRSGRPSSQPAKGFEPRRRAAHA